MLQNILTYIYIYICTYIFFLEYNYWINSKSKIADLKVYILLY